MKYRSCRRTDSNDPTLAHNNTLSTMPSIEGSRQDDELTELRNPNIRNYGKLSASDEGSLRKHSGGNNPSRVRRTDAPVIPRRTDFGDYYPDGGWGWCVCGAAFIVHFVAHGIHLAFGSLMVEIIDVFNITQSEAGKEKTLTLIRTCRNIDEIFITGCTGSCNLKNFRCRQCDGNFVKMNFRFSV